MKKIVYIAMIPLRGQIERYLFIDDVIAASFDVEYWDLSSVYHKGFAFHNVVVRDYVRKISSLTEVKKRIRKEDLNTTLFIAQMNFNWQSLSLFYILTRFKCKIGCFPLVAFPLGSPLQKVFEKFRGSIFSGAFWQSSLNLFAKACRRTGLIKHYDIVFAAGSMTRDGYLNNSRVININYQDYDRYVLLKDSTARLVDGRYCVFLDEGTIANQDNQIVNNKSMDAAAFYGSLNRFFAHIERKLGVRVVIAAHPGIKYAKEIFHGREIFEGKTCELVKDCEFVISQSSLSVSFPVLYSKPIIFIYTDEYVEKRPSNWRLVCFFSELLGHGTVNISAPDVDGFNKVIPVDPAAYDDYKYTHLTSKESETKSSKGIVVEELAQL